MARGKGEGTIVKRKDGRYQASLQVSGRRRTVYGQTRQEVMQKLKALKEWAERQGDLPDAKRTVADLIQAWLDAVAHDLKPRALQDYRQVARLYILPTLGDVRLDRLTPARIQALLAELQRQGKHRAAQKTFLRLYRACKLGVMWGWLPVNPCDRVLRPRYVPKRREVWTPAQARAFLDGARDHWLWPLWTLALFTGCRSGELRALTWADVDLEARTLTVRRSVHLIDGEYVFTAPKTRAGERTIALTTEAVQALKRQRAQQAEWRLRAGDKWHDTGLIFTAQYGEPLYVCIPTRALARECRRLDLPVLTMHDLRHCTASLLLHAGLSLAEVARVLGHSTPAITAAIYSHAVGDIRQAADAIQKALQAR